MLTSDNSTVGTTTLTFNASGLVPPWGTARSMYLTGIGTAVFLVKCYGIDLQGNELIFYATMNGTANITTGNTSVSGSGGTSVNLTTDLRHINRVESVLPMTGAMAVYVRCIINSITTTLVFLNIYYIFNPIYVCPMGRRAKFKGFQMISSNGVNDYCFVVFKKPQNTALSGVHPISFSYRFRINDFSALSQNSNDYQWSDNGLVTINEGEWLFLNRETSTAQTNLTTYATLTEYKI
jgi:hypothetical protein